MTHPHPPSDPATDPEADLNAARELLRRTRDFLETCRHDPRGALEGEDPAALLQGLGEAVETARRSATPPGPGAQDGERELEGEKQGVIRHLRPRRSA